VDRRPQQLLQRYNRSIHPSINQSVSQSVSQSVCQSVSQSVCQSVNVYVCLSIYILLNSILSYQIYISNPIKSIDRPINRLTMQSNN